MNQFIYYPKCSTCQEIKKYLEQNHILFQERKLNEENITKEELKEWSRKYKIEISRFFNTRGVLYRKLSLKDKINQMSEEEQLELLSQHYMLIKRPLLITPTKCLIGSSKKEYEQI